MTQKVTTEQVLDQVKTAYGFVPNLMGIMTEHHPGVAQAYLSVGGALENGVLSPAERQLVTLAVSAFNGCHHCTAVHRTVAKSMGVGQAELDAVDALAAPPDPRLGTLVAATWTLLRERGRVDPSSRHRLSVSTAELFELIAVIGMKTISNCINHVIGTEVDQAFLQQGATRARAKALP